MKMNMKKLNEIEKEFDEMINRMYSRTQKLGDAADLDLLVSGKDVLEVKRTKYPDCATEHFLYITKGKKNLILWGAGHGGRGDVYGRVIKLPLDEISYDGGAITIPEIHFNLFFNLKEKSHKKLYEAGLLVRQNG